MSARRLALLLCVGGLLVPTHRLMATTVVVKTGPVGDTKIDVNFRFPPTPQMLSEVENEIQRAKLALCDATDGKIKIKKVNMTVGDGFQESGDVWIMPNDGRSDANVNGAWSRGKIRLFPEFTRRLSSGADELVYNGKTLAHELGHYILGLGDSYDEQTRWGGGCGIGPSFDPNHTGVQTNRAQWNTLMEGTPMFCRYAGPQTEHHGKLRSQFNPDWTDLRCARNTDCERADRPRYCSATGCPAQHPTVTPPSWVCDAPAGQVEVGSSELSVAENNDCIRTGDPRLDMCVPGPEIAQSCPGPRPAKKMTVVMKLDPADHTLLPSPGLPGPKCGDSMADATLAEQCDLGPNNDRATIPVPGVDCQTFGIPDTGRVVSCSRHCAFDKKFCFHAIGATNPEKCAAVAANSTRPEHNCVLGPADTMVVPPGISCSTFGFPGGELECLHNCSIGFSKCSGAGDTAPDFTNYDTMSATVPFTTVEIIDGKGDIILKDGKEAGSRHPTYLAVKRLREHDWMLFVVGRGEDYDGGTAGQLTVVESSLFTFDSMGRVVDPTRTITIGDAPAFLTGAAKIDLETSIQATLGRWQLPVAGQTGGTSFKRGTAVFAADGLTQGGRCADTESALICRHGWNNVTKRYESTSQTLDQIIDMGRSPANVVSDWKLWTDNLRRRGVNVQPIDTLPDVAAPPECNEPVEFVDDDLGEADRIFLVLDRSGSMSTPIDARKTGGTGFGESRLAFAKAGARAFVRAQVGRPVQVGLVVFNHDAQVRQGLTRIVADNSSTVPPGSMKAQDFIDQFIDAPDLTAGGNTAIGTAMRVAGAALPEAAVANTLLLLTDGENNRPTNGTDKPIDVANALADKSIRVFTVPAGDSANKIQSGEIAAITGGVRLDAPVGDEVPSAFMEAYARSRGETVVRPRTPSVVVKLERCGADEVFQCPAGKEVRHAGSDCFCIDPANPPSIITDEVDAISVKVEPGAARLNVTLTGRNKSIGTWSPEFRLLDPNGTPRTDFTVVNDPFFKLVSLNAPQAGTWTFEVRATNDTPQWSYVLGHVENAVPDCFAGVTPTTAVDGDQVVVEAHAYSESVELNQKITFTGVVKGPDGFSTFFTFGETKGSGGAKAIVPASALSGRGLYEVRVTCQIESGAQAAPGEPMNPEMPYNHVNVVPFERNVTTGFFLDTATLPPLPPGGDCDNNGIPDTVEGRGDTDGDGTPDDCDSDDDNDDDPDATDSGRLDPSCQGSGCPVARAGADQVLECTSASGAVATLNGSASSDPANLPLTFAWSAPPVTLQNPNQAVASGTFPFGPTAAALVVSNGTKSSQDSALVTVLDRVGPSLMAPADLTIGNCMPPSLGTASVSDACGGTVTVLNNAPAVFPLGITVVTWTAIDQFGNVSTDDQNVTITASSAPSLDEPADIDVSSCSVPGLGTAAGADACGGPVLITNNAPAAFPVGTTVVTWVATDVLGNTTARTQNVTVDVAGPPVVDAPATVVVNTCAVPALGTATATDACGVPLMPFNDAPSVFPVGNTTVIWRVTDGRGTMASDTQLVTVNVMTPPSLTAPPDKVFNSCTATGLGTASAADACGTALLTTNDAPATFPMGTTPVTWRTTDNRGQQTTKIQQVTVNGPATPPTLTVPGPLTISSCNSPNLGSATGANACGGPVTITNNAPSTFPLGATTVTWKATDQVGRTTTATQVVTAELADSATCCPAGTNVITGNGSDNNLTGTAGSDCILGLGGNDQLFGLGGNDFLSGGAGNDNVYGDTGNDRLYGGDGINGIHGGDGADTLVGGRLDDVMVGGIGNDTMEGRGGADNMSGGDGDDVIRGGEGNDILAGDANVDQLFGDAGNDQLNGGLGNDQLNGGTGTDACTAGGGTDSKASCEQ